MRGVRREMWKEEKETRGRGKEASKRTPTVRLPVTNPELFELKASNSKIGHLD